jgi:hypothetical protein
MRRSLISILALLLLGAAAPPPPPNIGVTVTPVTNARRTDAVLPGHLLAKALPRGTDGRRRILVLTTPDDPKAALAPKGPRSIYLIDPERAGAPRRLLDGLPAETNALAALDLDGDGADEILLGEPGKLFTLGTPEAVTAPRLLLEASGLDLRGWSPDRPQMFQAAEMGRLRTWTLEGGRLVPGPESQLPVRAARERQALRLSSLPVTPVPPVQAIGPEENGKIRLRTVLLGADGARTETWAQLPGRENVDGFRYVALDGRPVLIVTTSDADKIGVFAKQRFRLFPLAADRSRSGTPPSLAFETESHRWFPVDPVLLDLDHDGKQDLVVVQPEGLGGGDLVIDTFFGQGNGRFEKPRRLKLGNLDARSWSYGRDITGDGVADLVTVASKTGLHVFAGTADPRRDLLDRRVRQVVDLAGLGESVSVSVGVGTGGVDLESSRSTTLGGPYVEDLDGNGRPEVLLFSPSGSGRGRVLVVRLGR